MLQIVDGFRLNSPVFRNAPNQYVALVDSQMLGAIEVVRGAMFGVAGLLGSLPYVEAPKDFDLRVRAKIAAGQPTRVTWFPSAARVAVPLGLMLSVGGYFGYQAVFRSNVTDVSTVTSPRPSSPGDALSTADVSTPDPASMPNIGDTNIRVKTQTADDKLVASANNAQSRPAGSRNIPTSRDLRGGSIDESIKMSNRSIHAA